MCLVSFASITLLAEIAQGWTNKEVLIAVGSTIAALIPVCLFVIRLGCLSVRRKAREAIERAHSAGKESKTSSDLPFAEFVNETELERQFKEIDEQAQKLATALETTQGENELNRQAAEKLKSELEGAQKTHQQFQTELSALQKRINRALKSEGPIWTERVRNDAPEFKPLDGDERRTPVVSVLNLKGGVGKTTIAANLGACLDSRGFRTLLVDLDLQGSLTGIFLHEHAQETLFEQRKMLDSFLNKSFDAEFPNLLDYRQPILPEEKSGLVPTADNLAYAEMNLSMRWLLRVGSRDPRFLLRRELQLKRITNSHDVILLDCPPLLNIFCVNALVASDYLLIPILPSKQSISRVPVLLTLLKEFRENLNPHLKVLGIVCNRTYRDEATSEESSMLGRLKTQCRDAWGEDVPQFKTLIRQHKEIRVVEDQRRPLALGDEMYQSFATLTGEVIDRLPTFCVANARMSVQPAEVLS